MTNWGEWLIATNSALELLEKRAELSRLNDNSAEVAETMVAIRGVDDLCGDIKKRIAKLKELFSTVILPECFDNQDVKTLTTTSGYRITATASDYVSLPAANLEAGIEWLRANGHDDVPKLTVNAGTLKSLAKEELEAGRDMPEEIFKSFIKRGTSVTKV